MRFVSMRSNHFDCSRLHVREEAGLDYAQTYASLTNAMYRFESVMGELQGKAITSRNGKPGATRGRKTSGLIKLEIAGLPNEVIEWRSRPLFAAVP